MFLVIEYNGEVAFIESPWHAIFTFRYSFVAQDCHPKWVVKTLKQHVMM